MINNNVVIEYGTCYVFKQNNLILLSKVLEKEISDVNLINKELNTFKDSNEEYIKVIENALEEEVYCCFNEVIGIKDNKGYNKELQENYISKSFLYRSYLNNNYKFKSIEEGINYIKKCKENKGIVKYDRITLKLILTTSFGNKLSEFIGQIGTSSKVSEGTAIKKEIFINEFNNNVLFQTPYNYVDFESFIEDAMEWETHNFNWKGYFGQFLKLFKKTGSLFEVEEEQYMLKDYIASLIHNKYYLFIPFMKENNNSYITLRNEEYIYNKESSGFHKLFINGNNTLFNAKRINKDNIIINSKIEVGYIIEYENNNLKVSCGRYHDELKRITLVNKEDGLAIMAKEIFERYIDQYNEENSTN